MALYETIFILDSLLAPEDIDKVINRVEELITGNNGKVIKTDKWGKRRLAYEIQKKQYGFYVAIEFESSGSVPAVLENEYIYNDPVLRYLTYRYDKNKIKSLEQEKKKSEKKKIERSKEDEAKNKTVNDKTL
jgi:small subunit ribosomal protein S6